MPGGEQGFEELTVNVATRDRALEAFVVRGARGGAASDGLAQDGRADPTTVLVFASGAADQAVRGTCRWLARHGFVAVAPLVSPLVDPASHASRAVLAQAVEDCVSYARSRGAGPGEKVVALGFGAGGYTAFLAACWSRIQLAVVVYADAIAPILTSIDAELGAWKRSVAPVHLVFGSTDPAAGARQVGDLQARLSFYRVAHDIVVYPRVGADFMDETSAAYRDAAADDAHRRLVGWISSAKHSRRQRRAFRGR